MPQSTRIVSNTPNTDIRPLNAVSDISNPGLARFFQEWLDNKGDANCPHGDCIDLLNYTDEARLWSILDVIDGGQGFHVRMCGSQIVNLIGTDLTGQKLSADLSELPGIAFKSRMDKMFRTVIDTSGPVVFGPSTSSLEGKEFLTLHSICLPFSNDGKTLDRLIHALAVMDN